MNFDDEIKKSNIPLDTERTLKDLSYLIWRITRYKYRDK